MAIARRKLIDIHTTPYYHVMTRCVRRAFLCGKDKFTGKDFSHRREWIETKLFLLADIFAIDVAAYAIMNNHYHLVLRINNKLVQSWETDDVFEQYKKLHALAPLVESYIAGQQLNKIQHTLLGEYAEQYRERLGSISWFMKILNQYIAFKANREDNCTGKFWESRFKSQALLDDTAVLTCMAYVDLNPIRANISNTPQTSDFTSIQTRLNRNDRIKTHTKNNLLSFKNKHNNEYGNKALPMTQAAYIELVDWTGRCIREAKRGSIPTNLSPILERINLTEHEWLRHTQYFEARYKRVAGTWESIKRAATQFGQQWFHGKAVKSKPLPF